MENFKVSVIIGAQYAYACIKTPHVSLDVQLSAGRGPAQSLRESAAEMRAQALKINARAALIERAAEVYRA